MRRPWTGTAVAILVGISATLYGCATTPKENTREEQAAAQTVLQRMSIPLGDAWETGRAFFEMGELGGGCAVLLVEVNGQPVHAAFWTEGGTVYAVNDAARQLDPTLPNAPESITMKRVRAVVH